MSEQYRVGDTVVIRDYEGAVPEGKVFQCWNTRPDGTGVNIKPGKKLKLSEDMHLYHIWRDQE